MSANSPFCTVELSDPRFERDGLRIVTVKSPALRGRGDLSVFIPKGLAPDARGVPLVILLHGVYGSHWAWTQKGGAHRTAQQLIDAGAIPPLVLAMPSDGLWGDGSGYVPHRGQDFERWIVDEVPTAAALAAPAVTKQSPVFLSGLSMGGYGTLRLGARHAAKFWALSAHSALTRFEQMRDFVADAVPDFDGGAEDLAAVDALIRARDVLPPLRFDCGTADRLLPANRELHAALLAAGVPHTYEEFPGGHEWSYWEYHLRDTLCFFAATLRPAA